MAPRKTSPAHEVRLREAELEAATTRTLARWDAAKRVVPWCVGGAAAVGVAWQLGGEKTVIDINWILGASLSVTLPAGLAKILWDRAQKKRLRKRETELEGRLRALEEENRSLRTERDESLGRLAELRQHVGRERK
jgi:hypothetical protein